MIKVLVHINETEGNKQDAHKECEFTRVPAVGEYISFGLDKSPGYEVTLVNHYGFDFRDDIVAELFVIPANYENKVEKAAGWKINSF